MILLCRKPLTIIAAVGGLKPPDWGMSVWVGVARGRRGVAGVRLRNALVASYGSIYMVMEVIGKRSFRLDPKVLGLCDLVNGCVIADGSSYTADTGHRGTWFGQVYVILDAIL